MRVGWVSAVHDRRVASFRYRVEAPTAGLRARGHQVEILDPNQADVYDVVVFSKAYSPEHRAMARAIRRRGGKVIFDLCDNHFYNPFNLPKYQRAREDLAEMMSLSDRVICSTSTLASVVFDETGGAFRPIVIGDIVERIQPRRRREAKSGEPLRLTWFGSHGSPNAPSGMTDLLLIREQLEALAAVRPVELTVCSNSREKFDSSIANMRLPTRYMEWSLEGFPDVLAETDAAVLPMDINPFTACKTHNRLTTALYAGVPVVASGIASYREFEAYCTLDDWSAGLEALATGVEEERRRAMDSRGHIDERWTMSTLASQWEAALALPAARDAAEARRFKGASLQGRLDSVARTAVTGWVTAPANPSLPLQVVLECDGEPVAVAMADQPREDLAAVGLPRHCGFSLPLPPRMTGMRPSHLMVRVLDADWIVGENPILMVDDRPSFAPAAIAPPCSKSAAAVELSDQRWEVDGDVTEQELALAELKVENANRSRMRKSAAKLLMQGDDEDMPPTMDGAPSRTRTVLHAGADTHL